MSAKKFGRIISGVWTEVFGTQVSTGVANAGDILALTDRGRLDRSFMPRGGDYFGYTDCMNATTDLAPFVATAVSNGTLVQISDRTTLANHPGVLGIRAGSNANSGYSIFAPEMVLEGGEQIDIVFQLLDNTTSGAVFSFRFGWATASSASVGLAAGACITFTGLTCIAETAQSGSRTQHATSYTAAIATWYHARIKVAADGNSINFVICDNAGSELWNVTNTVNLPTKSATTGMWAGFRSMQSTGGALTLAHIDIMDLSIPVSGTRGAL